VQLRVDEGEETVGGAGVAGMHSSEELGDVARN
jgi:hypothetical protein